MKIAVVGGVSSTATLITKLNEFKEFEVGVFGYRPNKAVDVSDLQDLSPLASAAGYNFFEFSNIEEIFKPLSEFKPHHCFFVGLSQLVPSHIMDIARDLNIGFHPTPLPRGRGRAPVAWQLLLEETAAVSFFKIEQNADAGAILAQKTFELDSKENTASFLTKMLKAENECLEHLLPSLVNTEALSPIDQDVSKATWYGVRRPDDGLIDWHSSVSEIERLVRAASPPHPGAFTFCNDTKIIINAAEEFVAPITGVVGRIVECDEKFFVVQTSRGLLMVTNWVADDDWVPSTGALLGYNKDLEIWKLKKEVAALRKRLDLFPSNVD